MIKSVWNILPVRKSYRLLMFSGIIIFVLVICIALCLVLAPPLPCSNPIPQSEKVDFVSKSDITQVVIHYSWMGLPGDDNYDYTIIRADTLSPQKISVDLKGADFIADIREKKNIRQGEVRSISDVQYQKAIDKSAIAKLDQALIHLQETPLMRDCFFGTDYYPFLQAEITYESGEKVTLYSHSNCPLQIPWNVIINKKVYVQYTGEIPDALYGLMNPEYSGNVDEVGKFAHIYEENDFPLWKDTEEITGENQRVI